MIGLALSILLFLAVAIWEPRWDPRGGRDPCGRRLADGVDLNDEEECSTHVNAVHVKTIIAWGLAVGLEQACFVYATVWTRAGDGVPCSSAREGATTRTGNRVAREFDPPSPRRRSFAEPSKPSHRRRGADRPRGPLVHAPSPRRRSPADPSKSSRRRRGANRRPRPPRNALAVATAPLGRGVPSSTRRRRGADRPRTPLEVLAPSPRCR